MNRRLVLHAIAVACCTLAVAGFVQGQSDPASDLAAQCQSMCKTPDGLWRSIPWETDLVRAQQIAIEQDRPLFIWAMDGHPLACT